MTKKLHDNCECPTCYVGRMLEHYSEDEECYPEDLIEAFAQFIADVVH